MKRCPHCGFFFLDNPVGLTWKQREVLLFIQDYTEQHGQPPSHEDLGKFLGYGKGLATSRYLKSLEERGWIKIGRYRNGDMRPRSINVVRTP